MSHQGVFGEQLRYWRRARGRTQLDLSMRAGYSQRHLSFLESGRSQPSRETVIVLSDCLDVPIRERNQLLHAAGFAPIYSEEAIDSSRLEEARRAVEDVLSSHRPFPALLVDRAWNTFGANVCAGALFGVLCTRPNPDDWDAGVNAIRLCIENAGMKPYIDNLGPFLHSVLGQLEDRTAARSRARGDVATCG
ncbi:MAG: helix-turn-helix domain-containing protein [Halioglobus sp.]|nr:helix-turn-helix domain-containing protein [Halioglobus sp.]